MNKPNRFLLSLASSALFCGMVLTAGAQQTPDQQTSPSTPSAQQPSETPQNPPAQAPSQTAPSQPSQSAPDSSASSQQSAGGQVFSGTVTKAGDKYVLQMADGTAYDLDHQDLVKKYEGKQVRVKGTLDQDGKTIHITQ
jgi:cytoskeletal protein RodZ